MSPGGVARHARGWRKTVVTTLREKLSRLNTNNICEQQIHPAPSPSPPLKPLYSSTLVRLANYRIVSSPSQAFRGYLLTVELGVGVVCYPAPRTARYAALRAVVMLECFSDIYTSLW